MNHQNRNWRSFDELVTIIKSLRGPNGCPWDREQTHASLTRFAIEEAYEFAAAVESGEKQDICGELGDMLLQVVLNAEIARQDGRFDIHDVIEQLNRKLIRRHPHVFGDVKVGSSEEVKANW